MVVGGYVQGEGSSCGGMEREAWTSKSGLHFGAVDVVVNVYKRLRWKWLAATH